MYVIFQMITIHISSYSKLFIHVCTLMVVLVQCVIKVAVSLKGSFAVTTNHPGCLPDALMSWVLW